MDALKAFVWNWIPYDLEVAIRSAVEPGFRKKHMERAHDGWRKVSEIEKHRKSTSKVSVAFFCHSPAFWNAIKSVFQAAVADPTVKTYLIALPKKVLKENGDISHEAYGKNEAYEFCRKFYPETIDAFNKADRSWFDLKALKPDYVVLSRPYDEEVQPGYRSEVLSTYTKICYVPYSYCKMKWDSRVVYNLEFMDRAYAVFTENRFYCRLVKKVSWDLFRARWKRVDCVGYPRFDLYPNTPVPENKRVKTVLWLPRWTTKGLLEATTFFRYKDVLIHYFKAHPQLRLICRPHPLMFENFISAGEMTAADVEAFKRTFAETENFSLDESGDYIPAFMKADMFLSDTSSLLIEEFITGKPIVFFGTMARFDREAKKWAKMMYPVRDGDGLIRKLEGLIAGQDPNRMLREQFIEAEMKTDGDCGKRIVDFIKADFFMEEKGVSI